MTTGEHDIIVGNVHLVIPADKRSIKMMRWINVRLTPACESDPCVVLNSISDTGRTRGCKDRNSASFPTRTGKHAGLKVGEAW